MTSSSMPIADLHHKLIVVFDSYYIFVGKAADLAIDR